MILRITAPKWLSVSVVVLAGCGQSPNPDNATASGHPFQATNPNPAISNPCSSGMSSLDVTDSNGEPQKLLVGEDGGLGGNTKVFAVASWCTHTESFIRAISDERVKSDLARYNLIFVLERDEWPSMKSQLNSAKEAGQLPPDLTVDQALKTLKRKAGNGPLVAPEFLDSLPGTYYHLPKPNAVKGFPDIYSPTTKKFDKHAISWVGTVSPRAGELYDQFEKEGQQ